MENELSTGAWIDILLIVCIGIVAIIGALQEKRIANLESKLKNYENKG